MNENKTYLLSEDRRIEPPPKRKWYGEEKEYEEFCRAEWYDKHYKKVRWEIDKHYDDVALVLSFIAALAWILAFLAVTVLLKCVWLVVLGIILSPFFGVISQCAILELLARWKASLSLRSSRKEKLTFNHTFKFGNQNGSK